MKSFPFLAFLLSGFFAFAPLGADTTNREFRITAFSYDEGSRGIDITFTSCPGLEYAIHASTDLQDWPEDLAGPIIGAAGPTTTVSGLVLPLPSRERLFVRVRRIEAFTEMVTVGNPGNAADTATGFGAVAYGYRIGKYEVTNAQYAAFLNAAAAADPNALYNTNMGDDPRGGITRTGNPGSYSYAVKENMGDKPVNFVSWYDALRFCNWLHHDRPNGAQGPATTEGGAYTLTAPEAVMPGTDPTHGVNGRNAGARFWLPSENEWYKAAYHEPGAGGMDTGSTRRAATTPRPWPLPTRKATSPTTRVTSRTTMAVRAGTGSSATSPRWAAADRAARAPTEPSTWAATSWSGTRNRFSVAAGGAVATGISAAAASCARPNALASLAPHLSPTTPVFASQVPEPFRAPIWVGYPCGA